jgi:L-alanine-DL-glutamate epimerase-like enolase superfamily enzyme
LGPEKGIIHLSVGLLMNSIWDLWAKLTNQPVWKLLCSLTPQQLIDCIDFKYIEDALTKDEALQILTKHVKEKTERNINNR